MEASDASSAQTTSATSRPNAAATAPAAGDATKSSRPLVITILAVYSIVLAIITGIPQLYYVLFAINPHVFPIGPNANPLGAVWYNYILGGQQGGYLTVDPGTLAGGIEDAFMMGPLYLITGIGLLRLSKWVYAVGIITGAMIFYADLYFLLSGTLAAHHTTTDLITTIISGIPYLVYPLWLVPTLLTHKSLFVGRMRS